MKRLNAYHFTPKFIDEGIQYLSDGKIPSRYTFPSRVLEFQNRYNGMRAQEDQLFYGSLQVVSQSEITETLAKNYKEIGDIGRDRFYALIKSKYVGISRPQVQSFLNNQELHQLVQQVKKQRVNKAIVTAKPMERWQADLVDVSKYTSPQNHHTTFLLTIIDCFSKFAWVVPLKNKQAGTVAAALKQVLTDVRAAPAVIQTDNGGEFEEEFEQVLAQHNIQHARSRSYNPQANGQIERFNGTLKRMIYAHMLSNNTHTFVPQLAKMVATYNSLYHTGIKQTPTEAHNNKAVAITVAKQIQKQAMASKRKGRQIKRLPINIGDMVRVALIHKALEKPVTFWTTNVFLVTSIVKPAADWDATSYVLSDGRKFTRDRLQKVETSKLVHMQERKQEHTKPPAAAAKKKVKEPVVPRAQPQRERAPSVLLRDTFVDY